MGVALLVSYSEKKHSATHQPICFLFDICTARTKTEPFVREREKERACDSRVKTELLFVSAKEKFVFLLAFLFLPLEKNLFNVKVRFEL